MKRMGIDFGSKRVGIALSDDAGHIAFPKEILKNDMSLLQAITRLCESEHVGEIVIGESLDSSGKPNPIMRDIQEFSAEIGLLSGIPVHFQKEFMTSIEARRPLDGKKATTARKVKQERSVSVDARAAALILQRYLDTTNNQH